MKTIYNLRRINSTLITSGGYHDQFRLKRRNYVATSPKVFPELFDIICVGAGPAGLSLLAALRSSPATANLSVALVESQDTQKIRQFLPSPFSFTNRCSSITPSSLRFLQDINVWKHIVTKRIQAYHEMQVWDGVSDARIGFKWPTLEKNSTEIAYMTENLNLTCALLKRIEELGGISIFDKQKVVDIGLGRETDDIDMIDWPVLQLSSGRRLATRLLVGADGANSPVRAFAGIGSSGWDYERVGVVATLEMEHNASNKHDLKTAYQRFLPTGPVAMLPLPGNYCTLVWSTTPRRGSHLKSLNSKDFVAMVNAAFRLSHVDLTYMHSIESGQVDELEWRAKFTKFDQDRIPKTIIHVQDGSIASFPLKMSNADTYIGERVALIGDAAHTTHPLAGQGLNQGLADVQSLVKSIIYAVTHGQDIGTKMALESYNSERYAANHLLLGVVDKLHKIFSVESGPLVPLRSLGFKLVDSMTPLKQFFMKQAAGTNIKAEPVHRKSIQFS